MGLNIGYFYELTPRSYYNISEGYRRKAENALKVKMTLNRDLEFAIISPYLDKKLGIKTIQDYKKFEWENEGDVAAERVFKSKKEIAAIWQKIETENNL